MCNIWWKWEKTTMWLIVLVCFTLKMKLNCHDRSDRVRSMTKCRQENDVIGCTSVVYVEIRIELSGSIEQNVVYRENKTEHQCDWLYRCDLWWKWDKTTTWLIIEVHSMSKTKLNFHDISNRLQSMTKIRHDNDMTNYIGIVYPKIETELSWSMRQDATYHENQIG